MNVIHTIPKSETKTKTPETPAYTIFCGGSSDPGDLLMWAGSVAELLKDMVAGIPGELHLSGPAKDGLFCLLDGISNTINAAS